MSGSRKYILSIPKQGYLKFQEGVGSQSQLFKRKYEPKPEFQEG